MQSRGREKRERAARGGGSFNTVVGLPHILIWITIQRLPSRKLGAIVCGDAQCRRRNGRCKKEEEEEARMRRKIGEENGRRWEGRN